MPAAPDTNSSGLKIFGIGEHFLSVARLGEIAFAVEATTLVLALRRASTDPPLGFDRFHSFLLWSSPATAGRKGQKAVGGREEGKKDPLSSVSRLLFPTFVSGRCEGCEKGGGGVKNSELRYPGGIFFFWGNVKEGGYLVRDKFFTSP